MSQGVPLDRQKVHETLWEARDRGGKVQIYQKQFAGFLGISVTHMSRVIRDFEQEGRIKKIAARYRNVGVYVIRDPADFLASKVTGLS